MGRGHRWKAGAEDARHGSFDTPGRRSCCIQRVVAARDVLQMGGPGTGSWLHWNGGPPARGNVTLVWAASTDLGAAPPGHVRFTPSMGPDAEPVPGPHAVDEDLPALARPGKRNKPRRGHGCSIMPPPHNTAERVDGCTSSATRSHHTTVSVLRRATVSSSAEPRNE
jgi:hypothetical protein